MAAVAAALQRGSASAAAATIWQRWRQRGGVNIDGRMAVVEAVRQQRGQQRGVTSGISAAGSAAAARQRCQRQLAGSALAVMAGSALAAQRRQTWPWQPPPPPCCHRALLL
jgi:hypothetical protein